MTSDQSPVLERISQVQRVATIGEVMIELSPAGDDMAQVGVAGDTYNTGVYLARLLKGRADVSYVTALGDDSFSDQILAHMEMHDLKTAHVERRTGGTPGLYAISVTPEGERSFTYWRSQSAARSIFIEPCKVGVAAINDFDLILLTGITMAILPPETRARVMQAIDTYRANGGLVAYDSNYRPKLWEDVETARQVNMDMWARTDIALPSVDDEIELFGDVQETAVLERVRGAGAALGALKRGANGPLGFYGEGEHNAYSSASKVVDTTAAGDSFNAGLLAALIQSEDMSGALLAGHTLAAHVVQHKGAIVPI